MHGGGGRGLLFYTHKELDVRKPVPDSRRFYLLFSAPIVKSAFDLSNTKFALNG